MTTLNRNATGNFAPDEPLMKALAADGYADPEGKLRRLPVTLLSHNIEDELPTCYRVVRRQDARDARRRSGP